jgi:hypothetical protein
MKQTAVDWFLTEFQKQVWFEPNSELDIWIKDLIPKAKEMEKEQMIEARATAPLLASIDKDDYIKEAEQYYNETYEKR